MQLLLKDLKSVLYTYFRNWRFDGTWIAHDHLRGRVRAEYDRSASPTAAIVDSQSVATATMVHSLCWFRQRKTH